jgi:hypothetical protein
VTTALTPALALDYLHQLSADIRAAVVLGAGAPGGTRGRAEVAGWAVLAGPEALGAPARALLAHGALVHARGHAGAAFGARGARLAVVVVTGPLALPGLTAHDVRAALAALGDEPDGALVSVPAETAHALLAAV